MYKKTVTYEDYDGIERTETFYFNLSKAELLEMELNRDGGLGNLIQKIIDEKDTRRMISIFKDIMNRSYGVKSDDGKRFVKNKAVLDAFVESPAYSDIYIELVTNADEAISFINGIMPYEMSHEQLKESVKQAEGTIVPVSIE